jgi:hypothetical protein
VVQPNCNAQTAGVVLIKLSHLASLNGLISAPPSVLAVTPLPAQGMWQGLTPDIFALFWTLTIHDLYVPGKAYESELEKAGGNEAGRLPCVVCCCNCHQCGRHG